MEVRAKPPRKVASLRYVNFLKKNHPPAATLVQNCSAPEDTDTYSTCKVTEGKNIVDITIFGFFYMKYLSGLTCATFSVQYRSLWLSGLSTKYFPDRQIES